MITDARIAGIAVKRFFSVNHCYKGRWYVIASKLGLPLFSLILLANTYVFQKNMRRDGRPDFYVVGLFFEKVKHFITHTYIVHGTLIRKNYVARYANQTIRIPDDVFERLSEFDSDFESIRAWYSNIDDEIDSALITCFQIKHDKSLPPHG